MALGVDSLDEIGDRIGGLLKPELPRRLVAASARRLGKLLQLKSRAAEEGEDRARARRSSTRATTSTWTGCPALHTWPDDGGLFLNLGLTHTKHPETGKRNLGLYRLQRHDQRTIGMHWQIHKDSTAHHAVAERRGERLPVAIAFGCPTRRSRYAATAPLPGDIDEYLFAGFLRASGSRWSTA